MNFLFVCLFIYLSSSPYIYISWVAASHSSLLNTPHFLCFCRSEHLGLVLLPQGNTLQSLNLFSLNRIMFTWNLTIHKGHHLCENFSDTTKQHYVQVLRVQLPEKNKTLFAITMRVYLKSVKSVNSLSVSRVLYVTRI